MQIWIDAKYIGIAMRQGRGNAKINKRDAARILGMTPEEYLKMERGQKLPPDNLLVRMMSLAFIQMRTRRFTNARRLDPLKPENKNMIFVPGK